MKVFVRAVVVVGLWACTLGASAQTGVSDDRVSLPDGPGSVDGFSDNADVHDNMGLMAYDLPIEVPAGHEMVTPELALSYGSGTGNTSCGMGWELRTPYIERTTIRGLPKYDESDEFSADGVEPLIELSDGSATYRARFERAFTRYRWRERGDGTEGFWTAEFADGTIGYFGADRTGALVEEARSSHPTKPGTFRYYLYEKVDPYGHVLRFRYGTSSAPDSELPILRRVEYVFDAGGNARYHVDFTYGDRADLVSDCKAGFCEELADRLELIDVYAGDKALRRYVLRYEEAGTAGLSRLVEVERQGSEGTPFPGVYTFDYSKALGEQCADCEEPYLVDMTQSGLGADIHGGYATLIDINGDALPDLLDTRSGVHTFYMNVLAADGTQSFAAGVESALSEVSGFELSVPNTQVLDVNGDGFADLANRISQHVLINDGRGDWASYEPVAVGDQSPDLSVDFEPGDSQLAHVRFLDYDNDKRIDLIRSLDTGVTMFRNDGTGSFTIDDGAEDIGYGFDSGALQLSDMNGDGLLDPVRVLVDRIEYRLNLGYAHWGPWQGADVAISAGEVTQVELEDLNGDQLSDLVLVQNDTLRYALSRNGAAFDAWVTVTAVGARSLPTRTATTAVLYADMNGNGSTDVVWADGSGVVTYLELFPVRPNLLTRASNGLGAVTEVAYGTSVMHMARDGGAGAWAHKLTHPMVVVDALDSSVLLGGNHEITRYRYRDGFYDGKERRFRGYAQVTKELEADEDQEGGLEVSTYDIGATDAYRSGLPLTTTVNALRSGEAVPLQTDTHRYDDCEVAEADDVVGDLPVRHVCEVESTTVHQEGAAKAAWLTTSTRMTYDGYGQVTREESLGIIGTGEAGAGACGACAFGADSFGAACGDDCQGDERIVERTFISPGPKTGGAWLLGRVARERVYGRANAELASETTTYYDGPDFEGLAFGSLTRGSITRVTRKVDAAATIDARRVKLDEHGNEVESLDPLATTDGATHRRAWTYDPTGLRIVKTEVFLEDEAGDPYSLVREFRYHADWDRPTEATSWMVYRGGQTTSTRDSQYFTYDEYGRVTARVLLGGDTPESPSEVYTYELGSPVSRIVMERRTKVGGPLDMRSVRCIDGRGRIVQNLTRLDGGKVQADGFNTFNKRGEAVRTYYPFTADGDDCDTAAPDGAPFVSFRYDALSRLIARTEPDAQDHGGAASLQRRVYGPLTVASYDEEDSDETSEFADTPVIERLNGLELLVAIERSLTAADAPALQLAYDGLGRLVTVRDAAGHERSQTYDLLDRVVEVVDPNLGSLGFTYDAAGNLVKRTDGRGESVEQSFDGANRVVDVWSSDDTQRARKEHHRYDLAGDCDDCSNPEGRLVEVSYPVAIGGGTGSDQLGYDVRGRTVVEHRTLGGVRFSTRYAYDNADRQVKTTFPDGYVLEAAFDDASRLTGLPGVIDSVGYDAQGQVSSVVYGDQSRTDRSYDSRLRLASLVSKSKGGALLQSFAYDYDRAGNLRAIADGADENGSTIDWTALFEQDGWYRPTAVTYGSGSAKETVEAGFDSIDNVVSVSSSLGASSAGHVGDLTYGSARPNAVTSAGGLTFQYDAAGNVAALGELTLRWDYQGRLVAAEQAGAPALEVAYGAGFDRVMKREGGGLTYYVSPSFEVRDGVAVSYARIGRQRVARHQSLALATQVLTDLAPLGAPDGTIDAGDALVAALDDADAPAVSELLNASARRLLHQASAETVYLHHDHLGTVTLATEGGERRGEQAFYAFGALRAQDGYVDAYGFTGQELDPSTGLVHFQTRYLSPRTGRWLSPDHAFHQLNPDNVQKLGESTTAYAYVGNRALTYLDPTGRGKIADAAKKVGRWFANKGKAVATKYRNWRSARNRPVFVYRGDGRDAATIQASGGFSGHNPLATRALIDHVKQNDHASQWVSTSSGIDGSASFAANNQGYLYKIRLPATGVDVNTHFANHGEVNPYHSQKEFAVPGTIPYANIVGVVSAPNLAPRMSQPGPVARFFGKTGTTISFVDSEQPWQAMP